MLADRSDMRLIATTAAAGQFSSSPYVEPERQKLFWLWIRLCVCFSLQDCFTFSTRKTLFNHPGTCCGVGSAQRPPLAETCKSCILNRKKNRWLTIKFNLGPHHLGGWGGLLPQEVRPCALLLSHVRWELNWLTGSPPADWSRLEPPAPSRLVEGGYLQTFTPLCSVKIQLLTVCQLWFSPVFMQSQEVWK